MAPAGPSVWWLGPVWRTSLLCSTVSEFAGILLKMELFLRASVWWGVPRCRQFQESSSEVNVTCSLWKQSGHLGCMDGLSHTRDSPGSSLPLLVVPHLDSCLPCACAFSPQKLNFRGTTLLTYFYLMWRIISTVKMTVFGKVKGYVTIIKMQHFLYFPF